LTKPPRKELTIQIVDAGLALATRTEEPLAQVEPDAEIVAELERASEGEAKIDTEAEAEAEGEGEGEGEVEAKTEAAVESEPE